MGAGRGNRISVQRVCRFLAVLAALVVVDGPMLIGQGWAWITMIHDRAPEMGLQDAVEDTLSGDHPCPMCLALAEERRKDDEEAPIAETRLLAKFAPVVGGELQAPAVRARTICSWETPVRQHGSSRWDDVPRPPPRMG